jgi:mgtE-like transporter
MRAITAAARGLLGLLGPDAAGARQSLLALLLNSSTSLVAGAFLGSATAVLADYPGLLLLVPAAIGLRGNVFGALGNRLSTALHAGTFRMSTSRDSLLGQNVLAAMILTLGVSFVLAVIAEVLAVAFGVQDRIGLLDMGTISIVGGLLGSVVVLAGAVALAAGATRYSWDLDSVTAPLVSTLGDVLTLPALVLATALVGWGVISAGLGLVLLGLAAGVLVVGWRTASEPLRTIVHESLPVLVVAGAVSSGAGVALEGRLDSFLAYPALLVLVPAFLSTSGALGGILAGRLSTKLLLGTVEPLARPDREARRDIRGVYLLAAPIFLVDGVGAHFTARLLGEASPGLLDMAVVALVGGAVAMAFVVVLAYATTVLAVRNDVDPDTYGIPVVSSSLDFVGAVVLIVVISALGLAG